MHRCHWNPSFTTLIGCVSLGKLISLSVQVSSYVKWDYNSTYLMGLLGGLAQTLSYSEHSTNVSCNYYYDDYYNNCELAMEVWVKDLWFPGRRTDKGFMEKVIPEWELEGWVGFPQADM